jgi:hypothetical protein
VAQTARSSVMPLASVGAEVVEAPECDEATLIDFHVMRMPSAPIGHPSPPALIRAASRCRTVARVLARYKGSDRSGGSGSNTSKAAPAMRPA